MSIERKFGKLYVSKRLPNTTYSKDIVQVRCDCGRRMDLSYSTLKAGLHTECKLCKLKNKKYWFTMGKRCSRCNNRCLG